MIWLLAIAFGIWCLDEADRPEESCDFRPGVHRLHVSMDGGCQR